MKSTENKLERNAKIIIRGAISGDEEARWVDETSENN